MEQRVNQTLVRQTHTAMFNILEIMWTYISILLMSLYHSVEKVVL